ncbi:DUF7319 domain-containing protein [Haloglomus halophilum]|uniref:DUF7319 domain-containing protein n=1 Tax=Haloglomus halophilum TaxID=2962672 RepID=UPI0020CA0CBF|nr:hypothetical protein [Haloglomus halophilum]
MADPRSTPSEEADGDAEAPRGDEPRDSRGQEAGGSGETTAEGAADIDDADGGATGDPGTDELRAQVEKQYDFEDFTPEDMKRMSPKEWDAAFDPDTWITGEELMDRVEADIKAAVVRRDVFARVERLADPDRIVAYSDEGYAVVYEDGSVEGSGTVLRDVKPVVALCSMEEYEADEMPDGELLPDPMEVPEGSGERGNLMLQIVAGVQVLAGLVLLGGGIVSALNGREGSSVLVVAGLFFLLIAFILFFTVANARLSDKFRAEEYRNRLRALGMEGEDRPAFMDDLLEEHPELAEPDDDGESAA